MATSTQKITFGKEARQVLTALGRARRSLSMRVGRVKRSTSGELVLELVVSRAGARGGDASDDSGGGDVLRVSYDEEIRRLSARKQISSEVLPRSFVSNK